jgi:hypothetical protein
MRRSRYHSQDPYWTIAQFSSVCSCGKEIQEGDDIFYYSPYGNEKGMALCDGPDCGTMSSISNRSINTIRGKVNTRQAPDIATIIEMRIT